MVLSSDQLSFPTTGGKRVHIWRDAISIFKAQTENLSTANV